MIRSSRVPASQPWPRDLWTGWCNDGPAATVRRFFDLINADDLDGFGALPADDFVEHEVAPGLAPTKKGVIEFFPMNRAAFPDMRMNVEDLIASGDKVVVRGRFSGTQQGPFMDMPPTGKHVRVEFVDVMRMGEDGLAHEHWGVMDALGIMQHLGAIPAGPPA